MNNKGKVKTMKLKVKFNKDEQYIALLKDNSNKNVSHNTVDTAESVTTDGTFIHILTTDNIQLDEPEKEMQFVTGLA